MYARAAAAIEEVHAHVSAAHVATREAVPTACAGVSDREVAAIRERGRYVVCVAQVGSQGEAATLELLTRGCKGMGKSLGGGTGRQISSHAAMAVSPERPTTCREIGATVAPAAAVAAAAAEAGKDWDATEGALTGKVAPAETAWAEGPGLGG